MGAVTALLCGARNEPGVVGVVADSPFSSLRALCYDLVAKATAGVAGEGLLVDAVLGMVASSVRASRSVASTNVACARASVSTWTRASDAPSRRLATIVSSSRAASLNARHVLNAVS